MAQLQYWYVYLYRFLNYGLSKINRMKKLLLIVVVFTSISCKKNNVQATLSRDCTGDYLTIGSYDYKVCNQELTDAFENGTVVEVDYRKVRKCNALEGKVVCELLHKYRSIIEIKSLKFISK